MPQLLALLLPLSLDTFLVSAALGVRGLDRRARLRLSILFSLFEGGMPLIGLALGAGLGRAVGGRAELVAAAIVILLGVYELAEGEEQEEAVERRTRGGGLTVGGSLLLALTISLDELALGVALGLLGVPAVAAVVLLAVQALVAAQLGLRLGARVGESLRERAEKAVGVVLVLIGVALAVAALRG